MVPKTIMNKLYSEWPMAQMEPITAHRELYCGKNPQGYTLGVDTAKEGTKDFSASISESKNTELPQYSVKMEFEPFMDAEVATRFAEWQDYLGADSLARLQMERD